MYARVIALPFDQWKAWYDKTASDLKAQRAAAAAGRKKLEQSQGETAVSRGGGGNQNTNTGNLSP